MTFEKERIKEVYNNIINDWKTYAILILCLALLLARPYLGNYINKDPLYCDRYEQIWAEDDMFLVSCRLTCARNHDCDVAWSNDTYFDHDTRLCHCGNYTVIDYYCYTDPNDDILITPEMMERCLYKPSVVIWG